MRKISLAEISPSLISMTSRPIGMIQMDVLIVGSLAYDSLETPVGSREDELGGSASYGGFSAAFHNRKNGGEEVALVGVIGQDFKSEHLEWYRKSGLEINGIEENEGKTFRWKVPIMVVWQMQ